MSIMNEEGITELQGQSTWYADTSGGQAWGRAFTNTLNL